MDPTLKQDLLNLNIQEEEFEEISMKEAISKWRRKARVVHPDKVSDDQKEEANTAMTELNKSLENILANIHKRDEKHYNEEEEEIAEKGETNEEQVLARDYFENFNFPQENTNSFTIHINNKEAEPWRDSFTKLY